MDCGFFKIESENGVTYMMECKNAKCMKKTGMGLKLLFTTIVFCSSIILLAGCAKPIQHLRLVKPEKQETGVNDDAISDEIQINDYSKEELETIIENTFREGYAQGYYDGAVAEKLNRIAHEDGQLYICIETPSGENQYSGISNLMCVCETKDNADEGCNYYVLKATLETLPYSIGMTNFLDGSKIDHNFDPEKIKAVEFEDYIDEYYGEEHLKACYEAFDEDSSDCISKYNFSDFEQPYIYDRILENK